MRIRARLTGFSALSICVAADLCAAQQFAPPQAYAAASRPHAVAIGDLNGDGHPDIVSPCLLSLDIAVLLGDGVGQFGGLTTYPCNPLSTSVIVLADLNGDGRLDVIIPNSGPGAVTVLLGMTNSGLGAPSSYSSGSNQCLDLKLGDLNGDGRLDAVTANYQDANSVSVMFGNGLGGFGGPMNPPNVYQPGVGAIALGDLNGDGSMDIATPKGALLNNGSGSFTLAPQYPDVLTADVSLGDLDGDGKLDLVGTGPALEAKIRVMLGSGNGTFGPVQFHSTGVWYSYVVMEDIDMDGHLDVACSGNSLNSSSIAVLLGNWTGGFTAPVTFDAGDSIGGRVAIGDLNGDLRNDMVAALWTLNDVAVLLNTTPSFTGLIPYGTGTPGCAGPHVLTANQVPNVNTPGFAMTCTKAPPAATGLWLVTDVQDLAGSDPFAIGATLHVGLLTATQIITIEAGSGLGGSVTAPAPIPNNPWLAGSKFYAQTIWLWPLNVCFNFPFGISTSNGLAITILP